MIKDGQLKVGKSRCECGNPVEKIVYRGNMPIVLCEECAAENEGHEKDASLHEV